MQTYKNTTNTSCVYDAFHAAGLPTTEEMKYGIVDIEVANLLRGHGYKVFVNGANVTIPENNVFVMLENAIPGTGHIEFHSEQAWDIVKYDHSKISMIAFK